MVFASAAARAQTLTVDVSQGTALDLGKVVGGASGATTFRVSPSGTVSVVSGTGGRPSSASVSAPSLTVTCTNGAGSTRSCANNTIYLTLKGTSRSGTVTTAPSNFTVSSGSLSSTSGTTTNWKLGSLTSGVSNSYTFGMDVPIGASSAATGAGTFAFSVAVGTSTGATTPIDTGAGSLTTTKALSIAKNSDLAFGRVVKPASGSSTVTVTAAGARTITGAGVIISSTFSPANYTVTGQASQSVSITGSAFNMTNAASDDLLVTPSLPTGLTAIGTGGTYTFSVGGAFTMSPTTPTGLYTGNFTVSAAYN
jgi:hypothetical protein